MSAVRHHLRFLKRILAILLLSLSVASIAFWVFSYISPRSSGDLGMARATALASTDPNVPAIYLTSADGVLLYSYDPDPFGLYETKRVIDLPFIQFNRWGDAWSVVLYWSMPALFFGLVGTFLFLRRGLPLSAELCSDCGDDT